MKTGFTFPQALLLLVAIFAVSSLKAQNPRPFIPKDTLYLKEKQYNHQWSYENNLSAFPPKRKNSWSVGGGYGASYILGDVRPQYASGWQVNIRKAFGHLFSLRAQYVNGRARGQNYQSATGFQYNPAYNGVNNASATYVPGDSVFYNYENRYMDLSLQGVFSFNNLNFYKKQVGWNWYGFAGVGGMIYETNINAVNGQNQVYDYSQIAEPTQRSEISETIDAIEAIQDGTYETPAEVPGLRPQLFNRTLLPAAMVGGGLSLRLGRRADLALEHRVTITNVDVLDGQRWTEQAPVVSAKADFMHFTSISLNFRLCKAEEAHWYANPLAKPMESIRKTKVQLDRGTKDSDGDGVVDALDQERNTPKGVAVDVRGVAIDSDMDGIPDFRDEEPFSPKGASVNRTGVALDSDNDGVADYYDVEPNTPAGVSVDARGRAVQAMTGNTAITQEEAELLLPMINFDLGKSDIKPEFYPSLYYIARVMGARPELRLRVTGHTDARNKSGRNDELSKARAQAVVDFLSKNFGIAADRFEIDGKASEEALIDELPKPGTPEYEGFQYLNRRVEFEIITK